MSHNFFYFSCHKTPAAFHAYFLNVHEAITEMNEMDVLEVQRIGIGR